MKAYLFHKSRTNEHYWPDYFHVCIDGKLHMRYGKMSQDGIWGGRAGDVNLSEDSRCFSPCDGKGCIRSLFRDTQLPEKHPLTPVVQKFLHGVLKKEAREEIPKQYVPFVRRVLSGEDPKKVEDEMLKERERQRSRGSGIC